MSTVYLNHAASSHPKPVAVLDAVQLALSEPSGDQSRGGAGRDFLTPCRQELARLFGVTDPQRIALLPSATHAINLVINGLLTRNARVVTTVLEHNAVLRPLAHRVRDLGVSVVHVAPRADGRIDPADMKAAVNPETGLVVMTHASNVTGGIQPIAEVAAIAAAEGVPFLIDAAQTAGAVELDHQSLPGRVFVAFAGHKGLLGPAGVGGLILPDDQLPQLTVGGTGIRSESPLHPGELPLRHEAGTPNIPGIAGLLAGVQTVLARGVSTEGRHRDHLVHLVREGLASLPKVRLLGLPADDGRAGIVSFNVHDMESETLGFVLRESFNIEARSGLHCAPMAHRHFGTSPHGALRVSFGNSNHQADAATLIDAISGLGGC